jgi:hypothetical protein
MDKSAFEQRRDTFEGEYFMRKDRELVEKLKGVFRKKVDKDLLRQSTGVKDEQLLEKLVDLNLSGELMAAFHLYPLVDVAWADGQVDAKEAAAVLAAAEKQGMPAGSKAHAYLKERLDAGPSDDHRKIWLAYANELKRNLGADQLATFREDVLDLCRRVAESSGGVLGRAFAVSAAEKRAIETYGRALEA